MLKEINKALMDPTVEVVGVHGVPGVGKSTLLQQVMEQVHKRSLGYDFDKVAMATVSKDPDLEKIQDELAYGLGLKFENEHGLGQKEVRLRQRLEQEKNKTLIVLDDIWKKIDLKTLGINRRKGSIKLLLTSRKKETLMNEMDCQKNFELKALGMGEAVELFGQILGDEIKDKSMLEFVGEVVEECDGLPIYITLFATKLKNRRVSKRKNDLRELRALKKKGMDRLVDEALKNAEAKKLFLLCGQIGSQIISIEDLLVYGMGLELFNDIETIEEGRERLGSLLEILKSFCLLEDYREDYIKIHDVMSKTSLGMASESHHSLVLRDDEKQLGDYLGGNLDLKNCESVSLPFVGEITGGLPERLKYPILKMFLSYNNENCRNQFGGSFFEGMKELKVLDILGVWFGELPSSIGNINGLHTLCLDRCKIDNLKEIGKLEKLQALTLRGSKINVLPKEVGQLADLKLLDLRGCYELEVIESDALENLVKLEELYLPESYYKWDVKRHASLNELSGMSCLRSLSICIPNFSALPHNLPFGNLKSFKTLAIVAAEPMTDFGEETDESRGKKTDESGKGKMTMKDKIQRSTINYLIEYDKAKTLTLRLDCDERKIILEDWVQTALHGAKKLDLMGQIENKRTITELSGDGFSELEHITVRYNTGINYVFHPKDGLLSSTLRSLHLDMLSNLEKIYQGNLSVNSLTNLRFLTIKACHKLRTLFSLPQAKGLSQIEEIEVSDCKNLRDVVGSYEGGHVECSKRGKSSNKFQPLVFKGLRKLILSKLPQISGFCGKEIMASDKNTDSCPFGFLDGRQVSFPLLDSLTLSKLPKLTRISEGRYPVKLPRLRFLEVKECEKLLNVVEKGSHLTNLEELTVESCESIKTILSPEKSSTGTKDGVLEKLMKLKLADLKSLETIWSMNVEESSLVRNLNQLEVSRCHNLTYLFTSSMAKSLQSISQIFVDGCDELEMIIFVEENDHDDIGDPSFDFPCLKKLEIKECRKMSTFLGIKQKELCTCITSRRKKDDDTAFFSAKVTLPSLEKLVLSSLEGLKSIWESAPSEYSFGKLTSIEIEKCSHLQTVVEENADIMEKSPEKPVLGFPYLTDLKIGECNELHYLFSDAIARTLFALENLDVSSCPEMSEVVSTRKEERMMYHKLRSLKLSQLPLLRSFSTGSAEHYFPFLRDLWIIECKQLEAFIKSQSPPDSPTGVIATPLFDCKVTIPNLEELHIKGLELEEIVHSEFPVGLFSKLKVLKVEECGKLSTVIPHFILPNLWSLESLEVKSCTSVTIVFEFKGHNSRDKKLSTSKSWKLKIIKLSELLSLEHICGNESFSEYFPFNELILLKVEECNNLRSIFVVSTAKILEKLQELSIVSCESMDQVIEWRSDRSIEGSNKIVFRQLSLLKLHQLQSLRSFCSKQMTDWPSLANMEIRDCSTVRAFAADSNGECEPLFLLEKVAFPKMESLEIFSMENMTELWNISKAECSSEAFPKLKTLDISECNGLSTIFPFKMVRGFRKLEDLAVNDCESLRQVFQFQGLRSETKSIDNNSSFPISFSLKKLELGGLPAMRRVWDIENGEGIDLSFDELRGIGVWSCALEYLFPASIVRSLYKLETIGIDDCQNMVEIVKEEGSSGGDNFEWRSLKDVRVTGCPKAMKGVKTVHNILSNLKTFETDDVVGLQKIMQFVDGCLNVTDLVIWDRDRDRDSDSVESAVKRFPWKLLERFHNLEKLDISNFSFEELDPLADEEEVHRHAKEEEETVPYNNRNQEVIHVDLPSLRELFLWRLEKLKQLYREASVMVEVLDKVEVLRLLFCDSLENLFPISASFSKLTMIDVGRCDKMMYLLTSSAARCLKQLTILTIRWCNNMTEIVRQDQDENGNGGAKEVDTGTCLPRLKELRLHDLPNLESFSSSKICSFEFCSLETVSLESLPKLKVFCEGGFTAPILHDIDVSEEESPGEANKLKRLMET